MKKLTFASVTALFCLTVISTSLKAQSSALASNNSKKTETGTTTTVKEDYFMDRYFKRKLPGSHQFTWSLCCI